MNKRGAVFAVASMLFQHAWSYEVSSHQAMTDEAVRRTSSLNQSNGYLFKRVGLAGSVIDSSFPSSSGFNLTPSQLVALGAVDEDNVLPTVRPLRHFFNPLNGSGLLGVARPATDWILEDREIVQDQDFSYRIARAAYYQALTADTATAREKAFGLTFESLGHVVHIIQDMAQPQHVRNDQHISFLPSFYSRYERYGTKSTVNVAAFFGRYPNTYEPLAFAVPVLELPRSWWETGGVGAGVFMGKGLAEFTNRNFLSAGTNLRGSPSNIIPDANFPSPGPVQMTLCPNSYDVPAGYQMSFLCTSVNDTLNPGLSVASVRAATWSIYTADLNTQNKTFFSLNDFNHKDAYQVLVPRAVAYSAGMIDYFFRGEMKLVVDKMHSGSYLIQNPTREAMTGTFAFFYEALDGSRKRVPNATFTFAIPAADAQRNPGVSPSVRIAAPNDSKTANEYLLVFTGDLGKETGDDASYPQTAAAVVGSLVRAIPLEGLYIAGQDAAGRYMSFRVDETGTHILNGIDEKGFNHYTVFDPVRGGNNPGKRGSFFKQTRFLGGLDYRVQSFAGPTGSFARDPDTQDIVESPLSWVATSSDAGLGWFMFAVYPTGPSSGNLAYTRTYRDAQGQVQKATGLVPLPALPFYSSALPSVNYQEFSRNSRLALSTDGLQVFGLVTTTTSLSYDPGKYTSSTLPSPRTLTTTRHQLTLNIALGTTPRVSVSEVEALVTAKTDTDTKSNVKSADASTGCGCGYYLPEWHTVNDSTTTTDGRDRRWIGVLRDRLAYIDITEQENGFNNSHYDHSTTISGDKCDYQETIIDTYSGGWQIRHTLDYALSDRVVTSLVLDSRQTAMGSHLTPQPFVRHVKGTWPIPPTPSCVTTGPVIAKVVDTIPSIMEYDTKDLAMVLSDSSNGIVFALSTIPTGTRYVFRDVDLGTRPFVGDASPLGEIFFATQDMKMIIHEPAGGRMPLFVPPANMVKITAAVWL